MKYGICRIYKEFVKPFQFNFIPESLKDLPILNSVLRESLISVLCKTQRN